MYTGKGCACCLEAGRQSVRSWLVAVDSVTKDLLSFHVKRKIQTIMQLVGRIQPPSIPVPLPFFLAIRHSHTAHPPTRTSLHFLFSRPSRHLSPRLCYLKVWTKTPRRVRARPTAPAVSRGLRNMTNYKIIVRTVKMLLLLLLKLLLLLLFVRFASPACNINELFYIVCHFHGVR